MSIQTYSTILPILFEAASLHKPKRCQKCLKETDDLEWKTESGIVGAQGGQWLCNDCWGKIDFKVY